MLASHYFPKFSHTTKMWVEVGHATAKRYIPIHEVCAGLGVERCTVLPAVHALTGCDSVSALFSIGKKTAMNQVRSMTPDDLRPLQSIGTDDEQESLMASRTLVACLYDSKKKYGKYHQDLNCFRTHLAIQKNIAIAKLPPCESSFEQHVKRANYQCRIWLNAHVACPNVGSPVDEGWVIEEGVLTPKMFDGPVAAEQLSGLICGCKGRAICSNACDCHRSGLSCAELCRCEAGVQCQNEWTAFNISRTESPEDAGVDDTGEGSDVDNNVQ